MEWMLRLAGSSLEHCCHRLVIVCILLGFCSIASAKLPSPGSSTLDRCHPEDVLLSVIADYDCRRWPAGRAEYRNKFVSGVARGSCYEARLSLEKLGVLVHEEWLHFCHGAECRDAASVCVERISFVVPPLPAGHYTEYLDVYDACDLSTSISTINYEENRRESLLGASTRAVDVEEGALDFHPSDLTGNLVVYPWRFNATMHSTAPCTTYLRLVLYENNTSTVRGIEACVLVDFPPASAQASGQSVTANCDLFTLRDAGTLEFGNYTAEIFLHQGRHHELINEELQEGTGGRMLFKSPRRQVVFQPPLVHRVIQQQEISFSPTDDSASNEITAELVMTDSTKTDSTRFAIGVWDAHAGLSEEEALVARKDASFPLFKREHALTTDNATEWNGAILQDPLYAPTERPGSRSPESVSGMAIDPTVHSSSKSLCKS